MTYTVVWSPEAEAELARLWTEAEDRGAVTAAGDFLDAVLRVRPRGIGESREGDRRVAFETPLAIAYSVIDDDRVVHVWSVWRTS